MLGIMAYAEKSLFKIEHVSGSTTEMRSYHFSAYETEKMCLITTLPLTYSLAKQERPERILADILRELADGIEDYGQIKWRLNG